MQRTRGILSFLRGHGILGLDEIIYGGEVRAHQVGLLGPSPKDDKEVRVLNRIVRWNSEGVEYEADPRQTERLVADCGLEGCKSVATPGSRPTGEELDADRPLEARLHTAFRGAAARGNYLSADRLDCQFACKEVCRWMANPTHLSWQSLKRLGRYLSGMPRLVYVYREQVVDAIDAYTDTDWAGCPRTRKSTSGGCIMLGAHTMKHWSTTQASISLSSGEAWLEESRGEASLEEVG